MELSSSTAFGQYHPCETANRYGVRIVEEACWQADGICCATCRSNFFDSGSRRHHCRTCGKCVCHDCSPNVLQVNGELHRVCTTCILQGAGASDLLPALQLLREQICSLSDTTSDIASLPPAHHPAQALAECVAAIQLVTMCKPVLTSSPSSSQITSALSPSPTSLTPSAAPTHALTTAETLCSEVVVVPSQQPISQPDEFCLAADALDCKDGDSSATDRAALEVQSCLAATERAALSAGQTELRRSWANLALVKAHVVSLLEKAESGGQPRAYKLYGDELSTAPGTDVEESSQSNDDCESTLSEGCASNCEELWCMDWAALGSPRPPPAEHDTSLDPWAQSDSTAEDMRPTGSDSPRSPFKESGRLSRNQASPHKFSALMSVSYPGMAMRW